MPRRTTGYVTDKTQTGGERWTGEVNPPPENALKAQKCKCEKPWTDYDPELGRYCLKCGKGYGP